MKLHFDTGVYAKSKDIGTVITVGELAKELAKGADGKAFDTIEDDFDYACIDNISTTAYCFVRGDTVCNFFIGKSEKLAKELAKGADGKAFDTIEDAKPEILKTIKSGDVVLVKASHSMQFENIVEFLKQNF